MQTDESLIRQVKKLFEEKTGWGNSDTWTNQDFLQLSELIRDETGITISHVTLKRVWGKVRYDSLPNTHTLNTLAQFLGYDNWRDLAAKHPPAQPHPEVTQNPPEAAQHSPESAQHPPESALGSTNGKPGPVPHNHPVQLPRSRHGQFRRIWLGAPILILILAILFFLHGQQPPPQPLDYAFSSKKTVTAGLPNSVIFDYDASRSPDDFVVIQQSWDTTRRVKVPKNGHQYTSIYYYPDFYHATLQVQDQVVKSHNLLIQSNGWLPLIEQNPVPVYFKTEEAIHDGKISLSLDQIREKNIPMQPSAPTVMFSNVRDFGEIYSDHFTFETSVRNDYSEGSAACQLTRRSTSSAKAPPSGFPSAQKVAYPIRTSTSPIFIPLEKEKTSPILVSTFPNSSSSASKPTAAAPRSSSTTSLLIPFPVTSGIQKLSASTTASREPARSTTCISRTAK